MTDTPDNISATKKTFYHEMHFTFECDERLEFDPKSAHVFQNLLFHIMVLANKKDNLEATGDYFEFNSREIEKTTDLNPQDFDD